MAFEPSSGANRRPGGAALFASVVLHAVVLGVVWWTGVRVAKESSRFKVYRVSIVSPPPQELGPPDLVTSATPTPAPAPAPAPPVVEKKPVPKAVPKPVKPKVTTALPKKNTPAKGANPKRGAEVGGSGLNVQISGEEFPFPDYLQNIILQIHRYFRWTGTPGLQAKVYFVVMRDGSVRDIRVLERSGSFTFDLQAQGAIEAAGNNRAFGKLPPGWEPDQLPVELFIAPPR
jgi:outer membrane biosynthesis protein TonB